MGPGKRADPVTDLGEAGGAANGGGAGIRRWAPQLTLARLLRRCTMATRVVAAVAVVAAMLAVASGRMYSNGCYDAIPDRGAAVLNIVDSRSVLARCAAFWCGPGPPALSMGNLLFACMCTRLPLTTPVRVPPKRARARGAVVIDSKPPTLA